MDGSSTGPRCDLGTRCPAPARETWQHHENGDILQFCHHHGRERQIVLYDQGFRLMETMPV